MSSVSQLPSHTLRQRISGSLSAYSPRARIITVFLASCVLIGAYAVGDHNNPSLLLSKEIGYAGLIAVLMIFTIEKYARDRHHESINKNMERLDELQRALVKETLNSVYDRRLPSEARKAIEKLLLDPAIYREDLKLDISFKWIDGRDALQTEITWSYCLVNAAGQGVREHEIEASSEALDDEPRTTNRTIWIDETPVKIGANVGYALKKAETTGNVSITLREGARLNVKEKLILSHKASGWEIFNNKLLTVGVKVHITHPADLVPSLILSTMSPPYTSLRTIEQRSEWSFDEVLLPGCTILLTWGPGSKE